MDVLADLMRKCVKAGADGGVVKILNGRNDGIRLVEFELRSDHDGATPPDKSQYKGEVGLSLVQELEVYSVASSDDPNREYQRGRLNLNGLLPEEELLAATAAFNATLNDEGL